MHGHRDRLGKRHRRRSHRPLQRGSHQCFEQWLTATDIHALFDAGLLTIGPDLVVYVSAGVDDPFYRSLDGKELSLDAPPKMSKEALRRRLAGNESSELEVASLPQ